MSNRDELEVQLAAALSRYVGYTTGATYLERIAGLTGRLAAKPFRYELEVLEEVRTEENLTKKTAQGVIDFAVSLGLLARHDGEGGHARLTMTGIGRAYRAAERLDLAGLRSFVLEFAVLEHDCDLYAMVLEFLAQASDHDWTTEFQARTLDMRQERLRWLEDVFPADVLVRRIGEHIRWLDVTHRTMVVLPVGADFVRHHTTPRRGWAKDLGHAGPNGLSSRGQWLIHRLRAGRAWYYWLGPDNETTAGLKIDDESVPPPRGPAWEVLRPEIEAMEVSDEVVGDVARFMSDSYEDIRLLRTNQAPLDAVRPFLYWRESELGMRFREDEVFRSIFAQYEREFAPLSGSRARFGHYQLRPAK